MNTAFVTSDMRRNRKILTYLLTYVYILTLSAIYMPIQERLYGFPGLFTDTSKHIGFFTFKFLSRVAR